MVSNTGSRSACKVYCEGKHGSLDARLLNRLLSPQPVGAFRIEIEPIGGKVGWSKFFDAYAQNSNYVAFGDRDLDKPPTLDEKGHAQLQPRRKNNREYLTGLPCIESYFLDSSLFSRYLDTINKPSGLTEKDLTHTLQDVANELKYYMAVRWALAKLRNSIAEFNQLGDVPAESLVESACLEAARRNIAELRSHYAQRVRAASVTLRQFDDAYDQYRAEFTATAFMDHQRFITWFDGKDMIGRWVARARVKYVTVRDYCNWAVDKIDFQKYRDLLEFRNICWYK